MPDDRKVGTIDFGIADGNETTMHIAVDGSATVAYDIKDYQAGTTQHTSASFSVPADKLDQIDQQVHAVGFWQPEAAFVSGTQADGDYFRLTVELDGKPYTATADQSDAVPHSLQSLIDTLEQIVPPRPN